MSFFLAAATAAPASGTLDKVKDMLLDKVQTLVIALIILVIGWFIVKYVCKIIDRALRKSGVDPSVAGFVNSLAKFGLLALLAIVVVSKLGVDMTSIIALLTSAALAVGLALQGSLANFAGGVLILVLKPFKVGDFIDDGAGHEGVVTSIEIIYTRLLTPDNKVICIPNGALANSAIVNVTHEDDRRHDIAVSVTYGEDIEHIRQLLLDIAASSRFVTTKEKPMVFVSAFTDTSVTVVLRLWCKTSQYWDALFDVQEKIRKTFDAEHINVPHNKVDVTVMNEEK